MRLGRPRQDERQGERPGPAEGRKADAVADRLPGLPSLGRFRPNDLSLCGDRATRGMQGEFKRRPGSEGLGEAEQEASSAQVPCPPLER